MKTKDPYLPLFQASILMTCIAGLFPLILILESVSVTLYFFFPTFVPWLKSLYNNETISLSGYLSPVVLDLIFIILFSRIVIGMITTNIQWYKKRKNKKTVIYYSGPIKEILK